MNADPMPPVLSDDDVDAFLRARPGFLAARPALFSAMDPPSRVHGAVLADHMTAMVHAARAEARDMEGRATAVLNAGRTASAMTDRVQAAVLALLRAPDRAECVTELFPGLLGVDAASLCCEGIMPKWRTLPPGAVRRLMQSRSVVFRDRPTDASLLHAEAALLAERDVLVAIPRRPPRVIGAGKPRPSIAPHHPSLEFSRRGAGGALPMSEQNKSFFASFFQKKKNRPFVLTLYSSHHVNPSQFISELAKK